MSNQENLWIKLIRANTLVNKANYPFLLEEAIDGFDRVLDIYIEEEDTCQKEVDAYEAAKNKGKHPSDENQSTYWAILRRMETAIPALIINRGNSRRHTPIFCWRPVGSWNFNPKTIPITLRLVTIWQSAG